MRLAVIGVGQWGQNLVRVACELLGAPRVSVFDSDQGRLQAAFLQHPDIAVSSSLDEVLANESIVAVVLATPAFTHAALAREALLMGKHVFVEKPLALRVSEAEALAELADRKKRILMVGHLSLYQPAVSWIKRTLESGVLGDLWSFHQERLNLGTVRTVENALWSLGVHDVSVLLHFTGCPPEEVVAQGQAVLQNDVHDDVYVHLKFPGQVQAHVHVSWLWPEKRRRLTIVGSKAMLVFDEGAQEVTLYRRYIAEGFRPIDDGSTVAFRGAGEPLRLEIQHFLECVAMGKKPVSDAHSAVAVVAVLEEASRQLEGKR